MSLRSIEEVFRSIAPLHGRGIPEAPTIGEGVTGGSGGGLSTSLSQAASEITQLRSSYQQQADLIKANTEAVQGNTSSHGGSSAGGTLGNIASGLLGGALGLFSPLITGIEKLFGGGSSQPAPLPVYHAPPPVAIGGIVYSQGGVAGGGPAIRDVTTPQATDSFSQSGLGRNPDPPASAGGLNEIAYVPQPGASQAVAQGSPSQAAQAGSGQTTSSQTTYAPQITVHVNAMDSQSFMDRSGDIANAVRAAMLNNHPINGVVAEL